MSRLLEINTSYQLGQLMRELRRIGCVLKRLQEAGQDERLLMNNIQSMMLFKPELAKMEEEYGTSKKSIQTELTKQNHELEEE